MVSEAQSEGGAYGGDPIGPSLFQTIRRAAGWKQGRGALLLAIGLVIVVVIIVFGLVLFSSMSRQSQSYKDGYSVGGAVYAADSTAQLGAQTACTQTERRGPRHDGLPRGANATQWIQGCVAAFASAQSDN